VNAEIGEDRFPIAALIRQEPDLLLLKMLVAYFILLVVLKSCGGI